MSALLMRATEWECLPSLPEGSGNFVYGSVDNDLILLGGIGWKNEVKSWRSGIWRFDAASTNWVKVGKLPWSIAYAAFGETRQGIYFAGGSDGKTTHDTVQFFNHKLQVRQLGRFAMPLCYSGSGIAEGKLFVVCGGADANDLNSLTNLFYAVDLASGKATLLPKYPGGKLLVSGAAATGRQFYVFGGATWDATNSRAVNTAAAFKYSLVEKQWHTIKPYPFPIRGLASCLLTERYLLLGGGYGEAFTDFAVLYDTETDSYLTVEPLPYRAMASFIKAGDFIYWLGGEHAMRRRSDAVYRIPWRTLLREALDRESSH